MTNQQLKWNYYAKLSDLIWPGYERVLKTTAWRSLDEQATDEQKRQALEWSISTTFPAY